jgi:hypothetical protein
MTGQASVDHATAVAEAGPEGSCRFCGAPLRTSVIDLGMSPLCEA